MLHHIGSFLELNENTLFLKETMKIEFDYYVSHRSCRICGGDLWIYKEKDIETARYCTECVGLRYAKNQNEEMSEEDDEWEEDDEESSAYRSDSNFYESD